MNSKKFMAQIAQLLDHERIEPVLEGNTLHGYYRGIKLSAKLHANIIAASQYGDIPTPLLVKLSYVLWYLIFPAHLLTFRFEKCSPMTLILGSGGNRQTFDGEMARFISNKPDLCMQWFAKNHVQQAIGILIREFGLYELGCRPDNSSYYAPDREVDSNFYITVRDNKQTVNNPARLLEVSSSLVSSLDDLWRLQM